MPDFITDFLLNPPAWATSDEAKAFGLGLIFGGGLRIYRGIMRFLKRSDSDGLE